MRTIEKHIDVLDGLRALAIFLVLARHSLKPYWPDLSEPFLKLGPVEFGHLLYNGWIGVDLFFVLSGFLITRQLLLARLEDREKRQENIWFFYKKRFFRIAPAYYLVLTLTATGLFTPFPLDSDGVWGWRYVYHLLFLNDYFPSDICFIFWSLAIEIKFYLLAPLIVVVLLRVEDMRCRLSALAGFAGLLILIRLATSLTIATYHDYETWFEDMRTVFHLSMDGLLAGMACALLWREDGIRREFCKPALREWLFWSGAIVFLALSLSGNLIDKHVTLFDKALLPSLLAFGFALMMLGLLGGCRAARLFKGVVHRFFARISYSLYLTHMLFLIPSVHAGALIYDNADNMPLSWLAAFACLLIISCVASYLIWKFVELPFISWSKKRITKRNRD